MSKKKRCMELGMIGLGRTGTDKMLSALRYGFGAMRKSLPSRKMATDDRLSFGRAGALWCGRRSRPQDSSPRYFRFANLFLDRASQRRMDDDSVAGMCFCSS